MAKNKGEKTNVMRVLEQKKIAYSAHSYPHEEGVAVDGVTVAKSMGFDPAIVFKTLVARGASKQYYVFDVPVAENLDLKKAAKAVDIARERQQLFLDEEAFPHGVRRDGRRFTENDRLRREDRLSGRACPRRSRRARARKICGYHC